MASYNNFKEYLKERFYDKFENKIKWFFIEKKDLILDRLHYRANRIREVEVQDLEFMQVYTDDKGTYLDITVLVVPNLSFSTYDYRNSDWQADSVYDIWVSVKCKASLERELRDFKIQDISIYEGKVPNSHPLDGDLVPYITKDKFESYAEELLQKFYPEAFNTPIQIDVNKLASKMGLTVTKHKITKDGSIFGQLYFKDAVVELYNEERDLDIETFIPAKTILVDEETAFLHSFGSYNLTVAHECLHFYAHKKAFKFAQILNKELNLLQCETKGGLVGVTENSSAFRMEIQANGIAPYILMPRKTFLEKAKSVMNMYSVLYTDELDYIENAIQDLAQFFGVSIYAARKRMIEVGFDIAQGAFNWADGKYVKPYCYKKGSCGKDESFTISFSEFNEQLYSMGELVFELIQGKYIFIENHVCLNNEKYIVKNEQGKLELTNYARHHIDECCVKFQCVPTQQLSFNGDFVTMCYLCRNSSKDLTFDLRLRSEPALLKDPNLQAMNEAYNKEIQTIQKDISYLPLNEIIKYFLKYFEMDKYELAIDSDLSDKTIARYIKGTPHPEKRTVIAIIIGFRLPPMISTIVLKQANIVLNPIDNVDNTLRNVLIALYGHSIDDVNGFLIGSGYDALSKK